MQEERLWVDFNDIYRDNYIEADLDFNPPRLVERLSEGSWVQLYDGEGNECSGLVDDVSRTPIIVIKLDLSTWSSVNFKIVSESWQPRFEPIWANENVVHHAAG